MHFLASTHTSKSKNNSEKPFLQLISSNSISHYFGTVIALIYALNEEIL